jgi:GT2 family glycosyltransferase
MPCVRLPNHSHLVYKYPMPQCKVIIVNWNSWDVLARCLEKLESQTYKNFKVLVIDNASSQAVPNELPASYPNVAFIHNQANTGFAAANNQGIKLIADSEWVALLNPDAFPEPDWLENLINAAEKNPDYSAFGSRQLIAGNDDFLDGDGDVYHVSGLVWRDGFGQRVKSNEPREIFSPCAAAALYRSEAIQAIGGFDEDFFCYIEDIDLGFRLRLMGHRCMLVPGAVVHHIGSAASGGQHSDFATYHGHRNLVWTFVKDMPGILFWLLLPLHLSLNLATIIWFTVRGRGGVIWRAKRDALLGLPNMWRKRQHIQRNRFVSIGEVWQQLDKRLNITKLGRT